VKLLQNTWNQYMIRGIANKLLKPYGVTVTTGALANIDKNCASLDDAARHVAAATIHEHITGAANIPTHAIDTILSEGRGLPVFLNLSDPLRRIALDFHNNTASSCIEDAVHVVNHIDNLCKQHGVDVASCDSVNQLNGSLPTAHLHFAGVEHLQGKAKTEMVKLLMNTGYYPPLNDLPKLEAESPMRHAAADAYMHLFRARPFDVSAGSIETLREILPNATKRVDLEKHIGAALRKAYDSGHPISRQHIDVLEYIGTPVHKTMVGCNAFVRGVDHETYLWGAGRDSHRAWLRAYGTEEKVRPEDACFAVHKTPVIYKTADMQSAGFGVFVGANRDHSTFVITTGSPHPRPAFIAKKDLVFWEMAPILERTANGAIQCCHPNSPTHGDAYDRLADASTSGEAHYHPQAAYMKEHAVVSAQDQALIDCMVKAYCKATEQVKAAGKAVVEHSKSKNEDGGLAA